jgi:hypothetical protein
MKYLWIQARALPPCLFILYYLGAAAGARKKDEGRVGEVSQAYTPSFYYNLVKH